LAAADFFAGLGCASSFAISSGAGAAADLRRDEEEVAMRYQLKGV
jgi:hypothetical protein